MTSNYPAAIKWVEDHVDAFSSAELDRPRETLQRYLPGYVSFPDARKDQLENVLEREKDSRKPKRFDPYEDYEATL